MRRDDGVRGGVGALGLSHNIYENENDGSVKRHGCCDGGRYEDEY